MSDWAKGVFLHIPKTAGTTLTSILERNYAAKEIVRLYEPSTFEEQLVEGIKNRDSKMLFGHFPYIDALNNDSLYTFTFLREPVLRTISTYIHLKYSPDRIHKKWMRDVKAFPDFLKMPQSFNWQVRHLSGQKYVADFGKDLNASLEMAKENLLRMNCVGITERFSESLLCLSTDLGWNKLRHQNQNVRQQNDEAKAIYDNYYEQIAEENKVDYVLYELGQQLLNDHVSEITALQKALFKFRNLL